MSELNLFINNLISQAKNNRLFIAKIATLLLQGDIKQFVVFFDNLSDKDRQKIVSGAVIKNKIINAMSKLDNFDQSLLDKLKSYGFTFSIKDYTNLKSKANYQNGVKELDNNIYSGSNNRLKYLQKFMDFYKEKNQKGLPIDEHVFKDYAEKIAFKSIEREAVSSIKTKYVRVPGKSYLTTKKTSVKVTQNLKTQSQKDFDFVFPNFATFISNNAQGDLLKVLSLLDLDFATFLKKTVKFDKDYSILTKLIDKIDLPDYLKTISKKEQDKFQSVFHQYFFNQFKKETYDNLLTKKNQDSAQKIFMLIFKLQENKFSNAQIKSIFDVFTEQLQQAYGSTKTGGEIVYEEVSKIYKPVTKKNKERFDIFYANYEKELLMKSISTTTTAKIKIHKL